MLRAGVRVRVRVGVARLRVMLQGLGALELRLLAERQWAGVRLRGRLWLLWVQWPGALLRTRVEREALRVAEERRRVRLWVAGWGPPLL
jgi:hypothetical protein